MVGFESTTLPHTFSIFLWKQAQHDDTHCTVDSKFNSLSTMETAEQLPTAQTHLTITQSSYVTQSQSKHAQHTYTHIHTHREGASVTHSPTKGVWRVMPNQKQKNVERVRILEASEWNDRWDTTARKGFDQGNNVKQLRKMKKTWSERMRKDQNVKARERERLYCTKRLYRTTMILIL